MRSTRLVAVALVVGVSASVACSHRATKVDGGSGGAPGRDAGAAGGEAEPVDAAPSDVPGPVVDAASGDARPPVVDATPSDVPGSDSGDARSDASVPPLCSGCEGDPCGQPACCSTRKVCGEGTTCTAGRCVVVACPGLLGLPGPPAPAIGGSPAGVATGDLNGDGMTDVIVSDLGDSQVKVLLGRGNATFATPVGYELDASLGTGPALGDINGDGALDVVVGTLSGVRVLLNAGGGSLSVSADKPTTVYATSVGLADFDGDGHLDLLVGTAWNEKLSVLFGRGDGTFEPGTDYAVTSVIFALRAIDVNGDARPDIVVSDTIDDRPGGDEGVGVFMNRGDGTFAPAVIYPTGFGAVGGIALADLNGDDRVDLMTSDSYGEHVSVQINRGDGTFTPAVSYLAGATPAILSPGDLNGDGKVDLVVTNGTGGGMLGGTLNVLFGKGDGTFASPAEYRAASSLDGIAIVDLNADGRADVVATNDESQDLTVLLSRADGTLLGPRSAATEHVPVALATQDLDRDGRPDLVVANSSSDSVSVFLGRGDGSFAPAVNYPLGFSPGLLLLADLSGDGVPDVAVAENEVNGKEVSVLVNAGDGSFGAPLSYPAGSSPLGLAAADLNGDGRVDLAVADYGKGVVDVLFNQEAGGFAPPVEQDAGGVGTTWVLATDVNGDGSADVVVSRADGVSVLFNDGKGVLSAPVSYSVGMFNGQIVAADWNGDGKIDLAVIDNISGVVNVLLNDGTGLFAPAIAYATGPDPFSVATSDLNGDGRPDLIVGHSAYIRDYVGVLLNRGDGTFGAMARYRAGTTDTASLVTADLDGDGRADVVALNGDRDQFTVLLTACLP